MKPFFGHTCEVVVTRAVVLMMRARLAALPLFRFEIGVLVKLQAAPVGKPELQESETLLGIAPVGVTVTV
jgi:hypothetical protein